jgi:hypothetical protein
MAESALARQETGTVPALSQSGLKDLAVSPLRYWYWWVNPERPIEEETPAMVFGTALHVAVLQPESFEEQYCRALDPEEVCDEYVDTVNEMREYAFAHGVKIKGTLKEDVVQAFRSNFPNVPVLCELKKEHIAANAGKKELSLDFWDRIMNCKNALYCEPEFMKLLENGQAEVKLTAQDPETGVWLSGKLDWMSPDCTLDVKTFSQKREQSIDRTITNAIWYEKYSWQAWMYAKLRALISGDTSKSGPQNAARHICAFVESEPPHEVRLAEIRPRIYGEASQLWLRAQIDCTGLIGLYAECVERFGDKPWRFPQRPEMVLDEEIPALLHSAW